MQLEHILHRPSVRRRLAQDLCGPGVFDQAVNLPGLRIGHRSKADVDEIGLVRRPKYVLRKLARITGECRVDDPAKRCGVDFTLERRNCDLFLHEAVDLVVKDQWQPGDAEQEEKDRAREARPAVNASP